MKKSILIITLTLFAVIGFGTQSFAQTITFQNDVAANVDILVCSTPKTLAAGEIYTTASTCTSAPCFFEVTTPCTGKVIVNVPCGGSGPFTSTQNFPGTGFPPCAGFTVYYLYDASGNITIHVY